MPLSEAGTLGKLRLRPVQVRQDAGLIWLRGAQLDDELAGILRSLPGALRFSVLSDGQLQPDGHRLPKGHLPPGPWVALQEWLKPELPPSASAKVAMAHVPLGLEKISCFPANVPENVREPALLTTAVSVWGAYGKNAPQVRLDRWTVAVSENGDALVRGKPLPPIPGTQYVEWDHIAVPLGWWWTPAVEAALVRRILALPENVLALFATDGSWQSVPQDEFVRATRAAIRASVQ